MGTDLTEYARSIGYTGLKPVIVINGQVASHHFMDWFVFCDMIRDKQQLPLTD